ncbi:MAG: calcium-binding protein, partial [Pseudomonadota bacterium]
MTNGTSGNGTPVIGGFGAQLLTGGAGDDVIYGDAPGGGRLQMRDGARDVGDGVYLGPAQSAGVVHAGEVHFFAAADDAAAGGVGGWRVDGDGLEATWSQTARYYLSNAALTGSRAVEAFTWEGEAYVITGGFGVSLSRVSDAGPPQLVETAHAGWGDGLRQPGAFAAFDVGGVPHILVGGGWQGGLTVLRWDQNGLRVVSRQEDTAALRLAGVSDIEIATIGDARFAVVTSHSDGGLSVFALDGASPALVDHRHSRDGGETRFDLIDAVAVEVARIDGTTYVYAASEDGKVITYTLDGEGRLDRIASQSGAHGLAYARVADRDWMFTVEGDRDVHVWEIDDRGRLFLVETLRLDFGAEAASISAVANNDAAELLISRADADGYDLVQFQPEGADIIMGGGGDDEIFGGRGSDSLDGGEGSDTLRGEADGDSLSGAGGDDRLWGGGGQDLLRGGLGADSLMGDGSADELHGEAGDDHLEGGDGADDLLGGADDDSLWGGAGADTLQGGADADLLSGDDGDDTLHGQNGEDRLQGDGGDDVLTGGAGADRLWGGEEDDDLSGDDGADELHGQSG